MSYMESFGFVYVLTDGESFKIGETSGCPKSRVKNLQCGNPRPLTLLRAYESFDRKAVERHLHEHLQPWRCGGGSEWFDCSIDEIDRAAEDLEFLLGAVDVGPIKLRRTPREEFTKLILDYWVNGETLTLCLEAPRERDSDTSQCLNFTIESSNKESESQGRSLVLKLGTLLGEKRPTIQSVRRSLIFSLPSNINDEWLYITYRRKRSRWIDLNDFELLSLSRKPAQYLEHVS